MTTKTETPRDDKIVLNAIPIDHVRPNDWNARRPLDPEFSASVAANGVLVPILVRPAADKPGYYQIVAGERRYHAAKAAKLPTIPAMVRELTDAEARFCTAIENTMRTDMTIYQEATILEDASKVPGFTAAAAAAALGWTTIRVFRRMRILKLIPEFRKNAEERGWTAEMAEALAVLPEAVQKDLAAGHERNSILYANSLANLNRVIAGTIHSLKHAPFDVKNDALIPKAGACAACPKRTGANADLFGEASGKSPDDRCLDGACWERKVHAANVARAAELKEKHGNAAMISEDWGIDDAQRKAGVIGREKYTKAKKGDKGAIPAVQMDGDDAGKTVYIKINAERPASGGAAEKPKGPKSMKEKREAHEVRRWCHVAEEVVKETKKRAKDPKKLELAFIASFAAEFGISALGNLHGYRAPAWANVKAKKAPEAARLVLWECVADKLETVMQAALNSRSANPKRIEPTVREICGVLGLDVSILKKRADEAIPEPASWARAAAAAPAKKPAKDKAKK